MFLKMKKKMVSELFLKKQEVDQEVQQETQMEIWKKKFLN